MKTKVLLIDDSSYMRGKIRSLLNDGAYEITEADSGMKALQVIASESFDIIFLDIIMPEMDGLKVLSALTAQNPDFPVVVVTADIQESNQRKCLELGAKAVLHKPPKKEELISTIERVVKAAKEKVR